MSPDRSSVFALHLAGISLFLAPNAALAQSGSALPATSPTQGVTAPLAATGEPDLRSGGHAHAAQVSCDGGQLTVAADNSSLTQILHAIARCTGMRISGGIPEQRVFGVYGPAAPASVLATLLDGTGSNMLLQETAADQPAQLVLTPRTGGITPPSAPAYTAQQNDEDEDEGPAPPQARPPQGQAYGLRRPGRTALDPAAQSSGSTTGFPPGSQTPVPQPTSGSVVTSPPPIRQPFNNVNGSPGNVSPTVGNYPTTDSVPVDTVATPSTTPPANGIVDAPNPPPAGSDTAAVLNGSPKGTPATTTITPEATSPTSTPGATNTTVPSAQTPTADQPSSDLTPQQVFEQLQRRLQQQQQQAQPPQPAQDNSSPD